MSKKSKKKNKLIRAQAQARQPDPIDPFDEVREVTFAITIRTNMCPGCLGMMSAAVMSSLVQMGVKMAHDAIEAPGAICDIEVFADGMAELDEFTHGAPMHDGEPVTLESLNYFDYHVANDGDGVTEFVDSAEEEWLVNRRADLLALIEQAMP